MTRGTWIDRLDSGPEGEAERIVQTEHRNDARHTELVVSPDAGGGLGHDCEAGGVGAVPGLSPRLQLTPIRILVSLAVVVLTWFGGTTFGARVWPVQEPPASPNFPRAEPTPTGELRINEMPLQITTSTTDLPVEEALAAFVDHFDGIPYGEPVYREAGDTRSVSIRDTDGRIHVMVGVPMAEGGASLRRFTLEGDAYVARPEPGEALPHGVPLPPGTEVSFVITQPDALGGRYQALCESGLSEAEVRRFFAVELEGRGWKLRPIYSRQMALAGASSLAYVRGAQHLTIDLFENPRGAGHVDFRISVLSRPYSLEPMPGTSPSHPVQGRNPGSF